MPDLPDIDITTSQWHIVRSILQAHVPEYPVWAFGSRAKHTAKKHSDLDLAVITETPLSLDTLAALTSAFSESDLPWKVDILDWASIDSSFQDIILKDRVEVMVGR